MTQCVLAIGNFDGVHAGHQALLQQGAIVAKSKNLAFHVLTFTPHPKQFFQPELAPFLIIPLQQRVNLLQQYGAYHVWVENFDADFSTLSPQDFINQVLLEKIKAHTILVGQDFRFGKNRVGDVPLLRATGLCVQTPALLVDNVGVISSTRIRAALQQGGVAQANILLGRPWVVRGVVQQGAQLGRTIGFPTANIAWPPNILVPKLGVYAGFVQLPTGQKHKAVANIGTRPTVNAKSNNAQDVQCEVHILDFNANLYGIEICFELHSFIRPEQKFDGLDSLKAQIARDVLHAYQHKTA